MKEKTLNMIKEDERMAEDYEAAEEWQRQPVSWYDVIHSTLLMGTAGILWD